MAVIIILCAIYIAVNRNTYLPFLGYAAVPPSMFLNTFQPTEATEELMLTLDVPDGTKVVYWAANNSKTDIIQINPTIAYANYNNSGISTVMDKKAIIRFNCPDKYKAGAMTISKHIHYRLVFPNSPLMSPVYTKYVSC